MTPHIKGLFSMVPNVNIPIVPNTAGDYAYGLVPIDTVKIAIPVFQLTKPNLFIDNDGVIIPVTESLKICTRSHYQHMSEQYILRQYPVALSYKPAKLYVRRYPKHDCFELVVELSLPKLHFGNNIHELTLDMFDEVVLKLHKLLGLCGVDVTQADIADNSRMLRIDIGKNLLLNESTPRQLITALTKLTKGYNYKPTKKNYIKGGLWVRWSGNQDTVFYDKLAEQKDTSLSTYERFKVYENRILRLEHRLTDKQTIAREYGAGNRYISLREAFNTNVCRNVLVKNFDWITGHSKFKAMLLKGSSLSKLYKQLLNAKKTAPYSHIPHQIILLIALLREVGEVKTKKLIKSNVSEQSYNKHLNDWHVLAQYINIDDPRFKDYESILEQLDSFQPFQIRTTDKDKGDTNE